MIPETIKGGAVVPGGEQREVEVNLESQLGGQVEVEEKKGIKDHSQISNTGSQVSDSGPFTQIWNNSESADGVLGEGGRQMKSSVLENWAGRIQGSS